MTLSRALVTAILLSGQCLLVLTQDRTAFAWDVSFSQQIRPIFAEYCLACHGPDEKKLEADLRLDHEVSSKKKAIVAGRPDESELLKRILSDDPDQKMPPQATGKTLTDREIGLLRQWISDGAKYEGHWAFEPIRKPEIPTPKSPATTEIDRFIVAALDEHGLQLSPRISKQQLIRRATFDLTGLPPTWDEVVAFVNDPAPNAFEKVINQLLDSSRYGERWGRHWLDIARYADTLGGSAIGFTKFPFSYTYRDYVIKAFNADLPYDQFIVQQLAADQLRLPENDPALAGVGFLTVGMQYRSIHDTIDDQIDAISRGLLGLTVACARCHDHKYDPIPTADYYSLYATLASSRTPALPPVIGVPDETESFQAYKKELAQRQVAYDDMARDQSEVMRHRLRMQVGLYLTELAKGTPEQDLSAAFLSYRTDDVRPMVLNFWRDYMSKMPKDDPVFGPWVTLFKVANADFEVKCAELIASMKDANGDPAKFEKVERLALEPAIWNPRMLAALEKRHPKTLIELAETYGELFAEVHQSWQQGLLQTASESAVGKTILPDEDPKHAEINSVVGRQLRRHLYAPGTPTAFSDEVAVKLLNRTVSDTLGGKRGAIHSLQLDSPGSPPRAMVLEESDQPPVFTIFRRGNSLNRGDQVNARFLTALSEPNAKPFENGQRRLGLARAIVSPENQLTRRVIVNWIWQNHFGQGLVRTPDDFGTRGRPPTNPLLLDFLASVFAEDGWSIKAMHRRIMLSDVYQQAAIENTASRNVDPDNDLFWRMPRRRLEMEAMRDSTLFVSGELDLNMGGRPINLSAAPVVPRRSVYGFINRDIVSNFSSTFDGANPNACTAKRPDTNVPQQTLYALNSDFIQDRAARVAALAKDAASDADQRVRWIYRRTLARDPEAEELTGALRFVESATPNVAGEATKADPWNQLAHALLAANEFVFVD
jgi:Protein of unknown function (DUF1553)/Protein of unknown function (DUF1549)/Planctomycete cytochrome C